MSSPSIDNSTGIKESEEAENSSAKSNPNKAIFQSVFKKGKDLSEIATGVSKRSDVENSTDVSEIGEGM